jgi:hypothetical protein
MPLEPTADGLLARTGEYTPLRAFSQGGRYWDEASQQLIRDGALKEFLPAVEAGEDDRGSFGRFFERSGGRDLMARSRPVPRSGIPSGELEAFQRAIEDLKAKAGVPGAQPHNREILEQFRLPDPAREPELYRLAGPWWHRRLKVVWGCERHSDSSLPPGEVPGKLKPDPCYDLRRLCLALLLLLLLLLPVAWLVANRDRLASVFPWSSPSTNLMASGAGQGGPIGKPADIAATQPKANDEPARSAPVASDKLPSVPDNAKASGGKAGSGDAARRDNGVDANSKNSPGKNASPVQKQPGAPDPSNAATLPPAIQWEIVLRGQGQPGVDGMMDVVLEVQSSAMPGQAAAVQTWYCDGKPAGSTPRLETRLSRGEHTVRAVLADDQASPRELSAILSVEPGQVITTPGKVSLRPAGK